MDEQGCSDAGSDAGSDPVEDEAGKHVITALVDAIRPIDKAEAELLSGVSHQLRGPLTSVVGFVEMLADGAAGPITAEQERLLAVVSRSVRQLMVLIDALDPGVPGDSGAPVSGADGVEPRT